MSVQCLVLLLALSGCGLSYKEQDILSLARVDILPEDENFFEPMTKRDFVKKFGNPPKIQKLLDEDGVLQRYAIILPFTPHSSNFVLPIPMMLDTGAPGYIHLSAGAVTMLKEHIKKRYDSKNGNCTILFGELERGGRFIRNPKITNLVSTHEPKGTLKGDARANLLGVRLVEMFGLVN